MGTLQDSPRLAAESVGHDLRERRDPVRRHRQFALPHHEYSDSGTKLPGHYDYQIASSGNVWTPVGSNPSNGVVPSSGWQAIYANPVASQSLIQPPGTTLTVQGQFDFSQATVTGLPNTNPYTLAPLIATTLG